MNAPIQVCLNSETGPLEAVILHKPGPEVENMTPANAERALYSDILNLSIATREYEQLKGVLNKVSRTFEVSDLLTDILANQQVKDKMVREICSREDIYSEVENLLSLDPDVLARQLIEGVPLVKDTLTRYISEERYLLRPLHNLFFTRDTAMAYNGNMLIGRMASRVRERESLIMDAIFNYHPGFSTATLNPSIADLPTSKSQLITLEGGDFQVASKDVLVIGTGMRTSAQGIDYITGKLCAATQEPRHIVVQELPEAPESFIHLDMVFTFLDADKCMVYEPIITGQNRFRTIHIKIDKGRVVRIGEEPNILACLKKLKMDMQPVACGGKADTWVQEREQWHSGANFFAFAPGKVIGYERNVHTVHELYSHGFEVITAEEVISGRKDPADYARCVVTIEGSELARGGGGARCMTMPVRRKPI